MFLEVSLVESRFFCACIRKVGRRDRKEKREKLALLFTLIITSLAERGKRGRRREGKKKRICTFFYEINNLGLVGGSRRDDKQLAFLQAHKEVALVRGHG